MSTPKDHNIRLYYPTLDHIFVSQNKEEIADYLQIWLFPMWLMQVKITQACLQFEAMH